MARALSKNGADVIILNLCHETHHSTAYFDRFRDRINYRLDYGIAGRLFNGRTKATKLINNLRISLGFSIRLIKCSLGFKPDCLILSRGALEMSLPAILICRTFGIRIIGSIMEYGPALEGYRHINSRLEWYVLTRFCKAYFLISQYLIEMLSGKKASMYLPVLIDTHSRQNHSNGEAFKKIRPSLLALFEEQKPILLYSCSKNYESLLAFSFEALSLVHDDYILAITGHYSEHEQNKLKTHTKELGIHENVIFTGYLSDIELDALENSSRALLIPLLPEVQHKARFPQKLLHYMLKKKPVITTDVGEISRFFHNRDTAYVCSPVTPEHYAETISAVLQDPVEALSVAERGCRFVRQHFNHMQWGEKMLAFIHTVIENPAHG
jgi:glycosyltransferase involved in cell wall biosynthesis